jgi:hypothetical protein
VSATVWLVVSVVIAAVLLVDALVRSGWGMTALLAPWVLLALWAVYVTVFASVVVTDADGVTVQNLLRRTALPWGSIAEVGLRYQLAFTTVDGGRVSCFGGPLTRRPSGTGGRGDPAPRTPQAEQDAERIRDDWERALADGARPEPVRRGWDIPACAAAVILVVWAVIAALVAYAR